MTRYFPDDDCIDSLAHGVIGASCPKSQWTHAAHFAVALWMILHRPPGAAEADMPAIIRRYNEATGVANSEHDGYHETITQASIAAARAFLDRQPQTLPLHELLDALMDTPLGDSRWLLSYWSKDRLFSPQARRRWVEPDLRPLSS